MLSIKHEKDKSTPKELSQLDPPELGRTGTCFIHPHAIRQAFYRELKSLGYKILSENIAISRGGARISLSTRLTLEGLKSDFDYSPSLGITMGANGRCRIQVYSGGILPDGAGIVFGKQIAPKFSPYFKLDQVAEEMIATFHKDIMSADRSIRNLKSIRVSRERASKLLLEACKSHFIRYVDVTDCQRVWDSGEEQTAWLLLKAFSLSVRDSSPFLQLERLYQLSRSLYDKRNPHIRLCDQRGL